MTPLKPIGKENYTSVEEALSALDKYKPKKKKRKEQTIMPLSTTETKDFSLEELEDFYRLTGVQYRDGIYQVDVSKALLPSGTQDQHAERRVEALEEDEFYAPDYPLFHSVINTLYQNRESSLKDKIEEARRYLEQLVDEKWLVTLTRLKYSPDGKARIIHNYKQNDEYNTKINNFTGSDGDITSTNNTADFMKALLSTNQSPQEISEVYNWLRSLPSYLWRVNSPPKNIDERVAWFVTYSDWSYFNCNRNVEYSIFSLGVRAKKFSK